MLAIKKQDFNHRVILKFEDGSRIIFEYAFALCKPDALCVEVYTEHCGYHAFTAASLIEVRQQQYGKNTKLKSGRCSDKLIFKNIIDGKACITEQWTKSIR